METDSFLRTIHCFSGHWTTQNENFDQRTIRTALHDRSGATRRRQLHVAERRDRTAGYFTEITGTDRHRARQGRPDP